MKIKFFCMRLMVAVCVLLGWVSQSEAVPVSFESSVTFIGGLGPTPPSLPAAFPNGTIMAGTFDIEFSTPNVSANPTIGTYLGALTDLNLMVGGFSFSASTGRIAVINQAIADAIQVTFENLMGPVIGGLAPTEFRMSVASGSSNLFSSIDLVPSLIPLLATGNGNAEILFGGPTVLDVTFVQAATSSASLVMVPTPSSLSLFAAGLLGLAWLGRVRRHRRTHCLEAAAV